MPSNSQAPEAALWQPNRHIPQLDGVRGLAILVVTLYRFSKELPTDGWLGQSLHTLFSLGDRGVDLFFVLSGFLITGILIDSKGSKNYFASFLARRSLRIFPLYFAALFLCLIAANWFPPFRNLFQQASDNQLYLWTYLTNIKMTTDGAWCFGYLDHFWSLAVEEHFYLVWPAAIFMCTRLIALRLAVVLAICSAGSRIAFTKISDNGLAPDVLTLFRCDALLIGSILALQIRSPQGLKPLLPWAVRVLPICLALGLASAVLDKKLYTIPHTIWPIIWACVLIWLLTGNEQRLLARLFNWTMLRKLGKYSYAMYVFQSPLIPVVGGIFSVPLLTAFVGNAIVANLLYMAGMCTLSFGAALLSWHFLEKHCLKLKDYFPVQDYPAKPIASSGPMQVAST